MNEQELKEIWRKEEAIPLKNIDMQYIQNYTDDTQQMLHKLTKNETIIGLVASALLLFDLAFSGNFYVVLTSLAAMWIYLFWKNRRDARVDELSRTENVRNFLVNKEKTLKRDVRFLRVYNFFGVCIVLPLFHILVGTSDEKMTNPLRYIISLLVTAAVVQIVIEFYVRRNYNPILEDLRYLIEQFDENENPG